MRPATRALLLAAVGVGLLADVAHPSVPTGIAAVVVMLGSLAASTRGALRLAELKSLLARRAGLLKFEVALVLGLASVWLGRVYVLARQISPADGTETEHAQAARTYTIFFLLLATVAWLFVREAVRVARLLLRLSRRPALLLAGSFGALIAIGTTLLALPFSVRRMADISFVDSLFTMTSAVCVTGLVVNDVGETYTGFGQLVLLMGIQLGGIGIMTLAGLVLTARKDADLQAHSRYAAMHDARSIEHLRTMMRSIVVATLTIEAVGALLLWLAWADDPRLAGRSPLWVALFHAVSAFCNAGFSLFPRGLIDFAHDRFVQIVLLLLVVLGGIGFPVLRELWARGAERARYALELRHPPPRRLTLSTRVVLGTTAALVVGGAIVVGLLESTGALRPLGVLDGALNALFTSVTARTAGFNTIDVGALRDATLLVLIALMFVGGSPASCAGGIKTTTAAAIAAALAGELRGREPQMGGRALPAEVIRRAIAVAALSTAIVLLVTLVLTLTETKPFLPIAFEAVSAFATVGLSTGLTPDLTIAGKLVIVATMFVGRVGPLTIAAAVGEQNRRERYRLAQEGLPIG